MYYHSRPASELIFLTTKEHRRLHQEGKPAPNKGKKLGPMTDEHKRKISDSMTGMKRGPLTDEHKKKLSTANKGQPSSNKGLHWKIIDGKRYWF